MGTFEIRGGQSLKGELVPQGAKNEALQVLCAVLLTGEKVTISNLPDIIDVNKLINLLQVMGVKIEKLKRGHTISRPLILIWITLTRPTLRNAPQV